VSHEIGVCGQGDDAETVVVMVMGLARAYEVWKAASRSMDVGRGSRYSPTAGQKARRGRVCQDSAGREPGWSLRSQFWHSVEDARSA
jgi:hypothetical protein